MYFCYIDEAGDTSAIKNRADTSQALLVICALFIPAVCLRALTRDFLASTNLGEAARASKT